MSYLIHYLSVQPWSLDINLSEYQISHVMGWIWLPRLLPKYYHKSIIRSIASLFGNVLKVFYSTANGNQGKFAGFPVNLDLSKRLISKINLDEEIIFVEYENLVLICSHCGKYGHLKDQTKDCKCLSVIATRRALDDRQDPSYGN